MNVKEIYQKYLSEGKPPKDAAKLAQAETGMSLVTGGPIRPKEPKITTHSFIGSKNNGFGMY